MSCVFIFLTSLPIPRSLEDNKTASSVIDYPAQLFIKMSLNNIWQLVAGKRFDYHEAKMDKFLKILNSFNEVAIDTVSGPLAFLECLR